MLGFDSLGRIALGRPNFTIERFAAAETGAFTFVGLAAGLTKTHPNLTAAAGIFDLSGKAAGLNFGGAVIAAQGSYTITGENASFRYDRAVSAVAGTFALVGQDANKHRDYVFPAAVGAFSYVGNNTGLLQGHSLAADYGTITITGQAARTLLQHRVIAGKGSFLLTGLSSVYTWMHILSPEPGVYLYSGDLGRGTNLKRFNPHARPTGYGSEPMKASAVGGSRFKALGRSLNPFRARPVGGD